jgi:hypothetical protein
MLSKDKYSVLADGQLHYSGIIKLSALFLPVCSGFLHDVRPVCCVCLVTVFIAVEAGIRARC